MLLTADAARALHAHRDNRRHCVRWHDADLSLEARLAGVSLLAVKHFVANRFSNIDVIEEVNSPVWIVHGQQDTLIGMDHAKDLHAKC